MIVCKYIVLNIRFDSAASTAIYTLCIFRAVSPGWPPGVGPAAPLAAHPRPHRAHGPGVPPQQDALFLPKVGSTYNIFMIIF